MDELNEELVDDMQKAAKRVGKLYSKVGKKLQKAAVIVGILAMIICVLTSLSGVFKSDYDTFIGWLIIGVAVLVVSWCIYGFGQLINDVHALRCRFVPEEAKKGKKKPQEKKHRAHDEYDEFEEYDHAYEAPRRRPPMRHGPHPEHEPEFYDEYDDYFFHPPVPRRPREEYGYDAGAEEAVEFYEETEPAETPAEQAVEETVEVAVNAQETAASEEIEENTEE